MSAVGARGQCSSQQGGTENSEWVEGFETPGDVERAQSSNRGNGGKNRKAPNIPAAGSPSINGNTSVDPAGGANEARKKPRGGLRVDYRNLGAEEPRSFYDPPSFAILINLDHPVVAAALGGGGVEEAAFRRLSYEIAFSEYAMALGYEMAKRDPDIPADDLLYEVRWSLNRVSVAAAALYR